ncbi:MAG: transcriptional repressor [Chitinophagales bacterium]|nr:transcriptional repressor [Chitinophagales bacterium]
MAKIEEILKNHDLRITQIRVDILNYFLKDKSNALTHANLEQQFGKKHDRVTIYRTLNSFLENGLVHKIADDSGVAKFAVCQHGSSKHKHDEQHIHFKCKKCKRIECLHHTSIPSLILPTNYKIETVNLLIEGICGICNTKAT